MSGLLALLDDVAAIAKVAAASVDDVTAQAMKATSKAAGVVIDDANVFNDKLQEWEDFYNFHRPHGGLGGQTPYERLLQRTKNPTPTA